MKFKKKGIARDSFRIPVASMGGLKSIDLKNGRIKLPKMAAIKMVVDREFAGNPKSVTVSKNKIGQFFVSVLVEEEVLVKTSVGRSIGIDLGLNHLVTLSSGVQVENPRWFREKQAELKRAQQHLSRKQKGSKRYERQRRKVARVHLKVANQRSWAIHNLTTAIINTFDTIIVEDLNVAGMKKIIWKVYF